MALPPEERSAGCLDPDERPGALRTAHGHAPGGEGHRALPEADGHALQGAYLGVGQSGDALRGRRGHAAQGSTPRRSGNGRVRLGGTGAHVPPSEWRCDHAGEVNARRLAGAVALIALACGTGTITGPGGTTGGPPPGSGNHPPQVTVPPAPSATPITEGGTTLLSVTGTDPDGDSLGYAWTQTSPATPQGSFSSRTVRNPVWTAPAVASDTVFTFEVTITDGQGGSITATCQVTVTHITVNRPPNVSATLSVSPPLPVAGEGG